MNHHAPHPAAGQTVTINPVAPLFSHSTTNPIQYVIEDWNDRVFGRSWMDMNGHAASLGYAMRSAGVLPLDNEVVYGHAVGGLGHLVHVSEIAVPASQAASAGQEATV